MNWLQQNQKSVILRNDGEQASSKTLGKCLLRNGKEQAAESYTSQSNFNSTKKTQPICKYLKNSKIISNRRPR